LAVALDSSEICVMATSDTSDVRITLRLPSELERGMRESALFFGRTSSAEWRAAAVLYRRVLRAWLDVNAEAEQPSVEVAGTLTVEFLHQLAADLLPMPRSLKELAAALPLESEPAVPLRRHQCT
jgi:hypothetical protein